jgi:hypothetical protein
VTKLLNLIRELTSELPVHIIVSSLEDLDINSYLHQQSVLTISTSPGKSNDDIDYFITYEIASAEDIFQNPLVKNSIFCTYPLGHCLILCGFKIPLWKVGFFATFGKFILDRQLMLP